MVAFVPLHVLSREPARSSKGFGLVELLVAVVIALATTIVIFQVFAGFEGKKRTTTAGAEATENGLIALLAIERDARHAGYGLIGFGRGADRQIVCHQLTTYSSTAGMATDGLMPVRVTDGGAGSDVITIAYSNSSFGATPARLDADVASSDPATDLFVSNAANGAMFQSGDVVLIAEPGSPTKPCARLRLTGVIADVSGVRLRHAGGASGDAMNPAAGTNIFPVAPTVGYLTSATSPALVINMGTFVRSQYDIANRNLRWKDLQSGASDELADNVVMIQAQYGVTASATSQDIAAWVNATGGWSDPAASDVARIKAIRVAVVSRSPTIERDEVTAATCTTPGGTTSKGPCAWRDDSTTSPAPAINLDTLGADWRRYRYRVYETVIPLRNVIWGDVNA